MLEEPMQKPEKTKTPEQDLFRGMNDQIRVKKGDPYKENSEAQKAVLAWTLYWENRCDSYGNTDASRVWRYVFDLQRSIQYVMTRDHNGFLESINGVLYQLNNEPNQLIREKLLPKVNAAYAKGIAFFESNNQK